VYYPSRASHATASGGLTMLFVGVCAVRKGVHFALEAWLKSPASQEGTFLIAGEFLPDYQEKLASMLAHPSVKVLGHRNDVPELMRMSDILILPSIEEGFGLVIAEAMGSGCVPLASEACTEICSHMKTGSDAQSGRRGSPDAAHHHAAPGPRTAGAPACRVHQCRPGSYLDCGRSRAPERIPRDDCGPQSWRVQRDSSIFGCCLRNSLSSRSRISTAESSVHESQGIRSHPDL
jgi:glycosyltransferase involved in cell wall biosynthesis